MSHSSRGLFTLAGLLGLFIVFLAIFPESRDVLEFERDSIISGEYWRLLTGHFVHLSINHALLNLASLSLLILLFSHDLRAAEFVLHLVACCLLISIGILVFSQEIRWYVGLSGYIYGLIAYGVCSYRHRQPWICGLLGAVVLAKMLFEYLTGVSSELETMIGGPVLWEAHWYGLLSGLFLFGLKGSHEKLEHNLHEQ